MSEKKECKHVYYVLEIEFGNNVDELAVCTRCGHYYWKRNGEIIEEKYLDEKEKREMIASIIAFG
jgi:hypothetical protein